MIPLLIVAGLFVYLSIIGQAVISLFRPRNGVLWSWFAAPTVGLSLLLIVLTRLNVAGIPVRAMGPWVTLALLVLAAASLCVAGTKAGAQETLRVGRAIANSWSFVPLNVGMAAGISRPSAGLGPRRLPEPAAFTVRDLEIRALPSFIE